MELEGCRVFGDVAHFDWITGCFVCLFREDGQQTIHVLKLGVLGINEGAVACTVEPVSVTISFLLGE